MIKNTVIAVFTAATLLGAAAPAFAEANNDDSQGEIDSFYESAAQNILTRLRDQGVNATAVEEWGGLVRAFVIKEDGTQAMQLFTANTLEQVAL